MIKKLICLVVAGVMTVSLFTACGSNSDASPSTSSATDASTAGSDSSTSGGSNLAPYSLSAILPGDTPLQLDEVLAEANKKLGEELNTSLSITFASWTDFPNKTQVMLAAGDQTDLIFDAPWMHLSQMISKGAYLDLEPLLNKSAQDLLKAFPQQMIDANRQNGKIMGIPLGDVLSSQHGIWIRGDLREKYGMAPIETVDQYEQYLTKVKENEKSMIPLTWLGNYCIGSNGFYDAGYDVTLFGGNNAEVDIFATGDKVEDIVPIYENPHVLDWIKTARKWYKAGLIEKDQMTQKDEMGAFKSGKAASIKGDYIVGTISNQLNSIIPGAKVEFINFEGKDTKHVTNFAQWNFICINANAKDSDRAVKFLNWMYQDQANYDILRYGIKDTHWVDTGDKTYDLPKGVDAAKNYNFPGYDLMWNPNFERTLATSSDDDKFYYKKLRDPNQLIASKLMGFTADLDPVKNEIAKVSAIWPSTMLPILNGSMDISELPKVQKKLEDAGYLKIVAEAKKQVDEFLASK